MSSTLPHYLLHAESYRDGHKVPRWKFSLQSLDGSERFSASDAESTTRRSRLELLAVVRGLEAIGQPARVTLLTRSNYVSRGIRRQLPQWREHHWQWERFGSMAPIRDYDLWRRVDRALEFHSVECCVWQAEEAVEARCSRSLLNTTGWSFTHTLAQLGRGVLSPWAALRRHTAATKAA
ncbi:MAG: hypothetical protein IT425_11210 [Pirellulales bacterium]|nr:hypothetical protein [Pirellulales bacterium]